MFISSNLEENSNSEVNNLIIVCKAKLDLGFLIDGSSSVGRKNFRLVKNFIKKVANSFTISSQYVRVGIVLYSSGRKLEFGFNQYTRPRQLQRAIRKMQLPGGGTLTGLALQFTAKKLFATSNRKKTLIVLTDGKSGDPVVGGTQQLAAAGVEVFNTEFLHG